MLMRQNYHIRYAYIIGDILARVYDNAMPVFSENVHIGIQIPRYYTLYNHILFAGLPNTVVPALTFRITTLPIPTVASSPILADGTIQA